MRAEKHALHATKGWSETARRATSWAFAIVFLAVGVLFRPAGFDQGWREVMELSGGVMMIVAALGRIWAYAHIAGRKDQALCRNGPYSLTRNPLYFFTLFGVCGAALALQLVTLVMFSATFFLLYYHAVIRSEERRLAAIFGPAFDDYCRTVPRFWPRWTKPTANEVMEISPRLFARNLTEVFWFLAAILIVELIEWAKLRNVWPTLTSLW